MIEKDPITQIGNNKPIVFISHVEENALIALEIKRWLEGNLLEGVEVFVSSDEGIKPGDKFEDRIIEKLRECRIALILCTQMSVRQPWINFEAGGALVRGARVIPICYHGQRKETLPRPLSSLQALDLSEPDDVNHLMKSIADEAGLRPPIIDSNELIERLPKRDYEELATDDKLPDIRIKVNLAMASDNKNYISLEAYNHDQNSIYLNFPYFETQDNKNILVIFKDSAHYLPVQTGELKPGDSRSVPFDPTEIKIDIDKLRAVVFPDKIGRKFKGSADDTLEALKSWKQAEAITKRN